MPRVVFTRNLQRHVLCPPAEAPGRTVREVLDAVFGANGQARGYVLDEQGALRKHMIIFVNGSQDTCPPSTASALPTDPLSPWKGVVHGLGFHRRGYPGRARRP